MAKSKIRIGILGSGSMGAEHANAYRAIENVEVTGVFSKSQQRAEAVAQVCGAKPIADASALLNDRSIDAIDVCLPSVIHSKFVIPALEEGKHVFSETPFALELPEAESMIQAARKFNRVLLVGLLIRSIAQYEYVRRVVDSGKHGKILSLTTYRLGSYLRTDDIGHKEHYSDPSTELMTFDFDFIQWILGAPTRLSATAVNTDRGIPGEISAVLDYDDGCTATVLASGIIPKSAGFRIGFRALFEKAGFELKTEFKGGPPQNTFRFFPYSGHPETVSVHETNPYEKELRYFVDCIRGEADPELLDARHALDALTLSIATQRSLQKHQTITIAEHDPK